MEFPDLVINESSLNCYKDSSRQASEDVTDVTDEFISTYQGIYTEPDFNESIEISNKKFFTVSYVRQVGREGSRRIPYPTTCGYKEN